MWAHAAAAYSPGDSQGIPITQSVNQPDKPKRQDNSVLIGLAVMAGLVLFFERRRRKN